MKKIKVGWSKGYTAFSNAIAYVEGWECSHTYVNFYSENLQRDIIYHANPYGVNFISKKNFLKKSKVVHEIEFEISDDCYKKMMIWCIDNAGDKPYAFIGLIGKLFIKMSLTKKNLFADGSKTVDCNELVQMLMEELGFKIALDPETNGPKALYEILKKI